MKHRLTRSVVLAIAIGVVLAVVAAAAQSASGAAGFIVDVKGRWEIARAGAAAPMRAERRATLNGGDVLRRLDEDASSYVVVALYTGTMPKYTRATTLPVPERAGTMTRIIRAIEQRFQENFVTASVRGGGDFHDAVVTSAGGKTDLSDVFKGSARGPYTIAAYRIGRDGAAIRPAQSKARIEAGGGAALMPALATGAYQVDISDGPAGATGSAWIGVVTPARVGTAAGDFSRLPDADGDPDRRSAARGIARAYLLALDDAAPAR